MMNLSTRCRYGIRAMLELASHYGGGPLKRGDIASRQAIPEAYLVQLFVTLRNHGLVRTVRGPAGGHLLTKSPQEISLRDIIGAFEGDGGGKRGDKRSTPPLLADQVIDGVWDRIEEVRDKILAETNLAELVILYQSADSTHMYHI